MPAPPRRATPMLSVIVALLLISFGLRIWQLERASFWVDEVYTTLRMDGNLRHTLESVLSTGNQIPLYYLLLHALPHEGEFALRYPSVLAGMVTVALLIVAARQLTSHRESVLWAGALLAVNPFHVVLSRTARPYALLVTLALLVSLAFIALARHPRSWARWAVFTLSSAAVVMTHFFGLMLPLAQYIVLGFRIRRSRVLFRRWLAGWMVAGLPFLAWNLARLARGNITPNTAWIPAPGLDDVALTFQNLIVGHYGPPAWYAIPGLVAAAVGLGAGAYHAARAWRRGAAFYWLWLVLAPFAAILLISLVRPLYIDRYFAETLPAWLLLVWLGLSRLPGRGLGTALLALVVLSGLLVVISARRSGHEEREGWRPLADTVRQEQQPGDGVLVQRSATLNAFAYYAGTDTMESLILLGISDSREGIYLLSEDETTSPARLWVVYDALHDAHRLGPMPAPDPFVPSLSPVSAWLSTRQNRVLASYTFNGIALLLIDMAGEPAPASPPPPA